MNFLKRTLEISKVYRPPSGSRKDEYDISFQEFFQNIKISITLITTIKFSNFFNKFSNNLNCSSEKN